MISPDLTADSQPIQAREHPIENDQIERMELYQLESAYSVEGLMDNVTLRFQVPADQIAHVLFILDDQNRGHCLSPDLSAPTLLFPGFLFVDLYAPSAVRLPWELPAAAGGN